MRKMLVMLVLVILGTATISGATTIYDNGSPTTTNGFPINSSDGTADDFTIAAGGTVRSVGFYFQNYTGITGWDQQVTYSFLADSGGTPGGVLASSSAQNVTPTLSSYPWCCGGGNAWLVQFDLASAFVAAPGQAYWLELSGAGGPSPWWVTAGPGNANEISVSTGTSVYNWGVDVAFYLSDTYVGVHQNVPEPATLFLLGSGLVGLVGLGWRRYRP